MAEKPIIFTEGKTDWKHIKKSIKKLGCSFDLDFYEGDEYRGDANLLRICEARAVTPNDNPHIFIFDRDNPAIIKKVTEEGNEFKNWGNKVFSFALPIPEHREKINDNICIEFYYSDSDLIIEDNSSRRLYISSEFNKESGKHKKQPSIHYGNRYYLKDKEKILDSDVFNDLNVNIALSKDLFATYVMDETSPFDKVNFKYFTKIIEVIQKILVDNNITNLSEDTIDENIIPISYNSKERLLTDNPPVIHTFVGRKNDLKKIDGKDLRVIAITGLGGEGKSTIAARYYEMAQRNQIINKFSLFSWSDFKDMETPLHDKLLGVIEKLSTGKQTKDKYADENVNETILRFLEILNQEDCLIVLDNVDGYVDKDTSSFVGELKILFEEATTRLRKSLIIFTCRSAIEDYHITFYELPLKGLSFSDTKELANNYGILNTKIDDATVRNVYEQTAGHALWLNLIFAQIRSDRLNIQNISEILSKKSEYLDSTLLGSIWNTLSSNEKETIQIISIFTRPPDLHKINKASRFNFQKCKNIINQLVRLRLVTEVEVDGDTHYDLHPIIRVKAREVCLPEKKRVLQKCVIAVLSFGDWKKLVEIMNISDSYTAEIDNYVQCAEIAIENKDFDRAIDYIYHVSEPLRKYGEDAKYIQLCKDLFSNLDKDKYMIGVHNYTSEIFKTFIDSLLEQGEYILVDDYLSKLNHSLRTIDQVKYFSEVQSYNLWFQNKFNEALLFTDQIIKKLTEKGEQIPSDLLYSQALARRDSGKVEEALKYFLQECDYEKMDKWNPDSDDDISSHVGNISRCLYLKKEYKKSLELCNKSVQYLRKGQSRRLKINLGYGLLWLSDIFVKQKKITEAVKNINEASTVWEKYCPSRLKKINSHIEKYPKEFFKKYKFKL
jgi:hypothetical protein